jgi:hypothetical protein
MRLEVADPYPVVKIDLLQPERLAGGKLCGSLLRFGERQPVSGAGLFLHGASVAVARNPVQRLRTE